MKKLEVFIPASVPEVSVLDFFSRHSLLESVVCAILGSQPAHRTFPTKLLITLLDSCSNLKHLEFRYPESGKVTLNKKLYDKLITSKLHTLAIHYVKVVHHSFGKNFISKVNRTLKTLILSSRYVNRYSSSYDKNWIFLYHRFLFTYSQSQCSALLFHIGTANRTDLTRAVQKVMRICANKYKKKRGMGNTVQERVGQICG